MTEPTLARILDCLGHWPEYTAHEMAEDMLLYATMWRAARKDPPRELSDAVARVEESCRRILEEEP